MSRGLPAAGAVLGVGRMVPASRQSDESLARQVGREGGSAFAALYERYHEPLYRYCRSILRDDVDAQDAIQSTFASALSALQAGHRNAPLRPWLFQIAHNEAISLLRRRRRDAGTRLTDAGPTFASSAADQAGERERWAQLLADLTELPERPRSALVLRELSGLSHEEIAIALGTSVGCAKQAIFEARQALAEVEEGRAMGCEEACRRISTGDGRALRGRRVGAHLRVCGSCAAFAAASTGREQRLEVTTPADSS